MNTILVTGANGQVGTALARHAWPAGWAVHAVGRETLDLTNTAAIAALVASRPWAAIVNAAAYTAVDKAEGDPITAWAVNALAPAAFAAACRAADVPLVQVSTDYVFDGTKAGGWAVDDATGPLNVYGASKLGGELAVRTGAPRHAIVRTSWVVSAHGHNFVRTMLRLGAERDRLTVVDDQHGGPSSAADLAAALAAIAMRMAADRSLAGIWHFTNAGETSWADFARAIFAAGRRHGGPSPEVAGIATADYPTLARRPAHARLDHSTLTRDFGIVPRNWRAALDDIIDELMGASA